MSGPRTPVAALDELARGEMTSLARLYRALDLFEYLVKALAVQQLHRYISAVSSGATASRSLQLLLRSGLQRPSLGHWVGILRETGKNLPADAPRVPPALVAACEETVGLRNRHAHGTTPDEESARASAMAVLGTSARLMAFVEEQHLGRALEALADKTPFLLDDQRIYNGIRKKRDAQLLCEYLDYLGSGAAQAGASPPLDEYLAPLDVQPHRQIDPAVLFHLRDYFERPYWEDKIRLSLRPGSVVGLVAGPGLGKSALLARVISHLDGWIHLYSRAVRSSSDAEATARSLAAHLRDRFPLLAPVPETNDEADLSAWFAEAGEDLEGSPLPALALDALDEAEAGVVSQTLSIVAPVLSRSPVAVSARSERSFAPLKALSPRLVCLRLEPLTDNEIRSWLKRKSPQLEVDDAETIPTLTRASEGNFLFLRALPAPRDAEDLRRSSSSLPGTMQAVFAETLRNLEAAHPMALRLVCLAAVLPDGLPEEPTRQYLALPAPEWDELLEACDQVFKPTEQGAALFHGRFREFVLETRGAELAREARQLVRERSGLALSFGDPRVWPFVYRAARDFDGLVAWVDEQTVVRAGQGARLRATRAVADAAEFLLKERSAPLSVTLAALDRYVDRNFQVLIDWRVLSGVCDRLREALLAAGLQRYPMAALGCAGTLYADRQVHDAIAVLDLLPAAALPNDVSRARYFDYRGLTYGAAGRRDEALASYDKVVRLVGHSAASVWLGYALMNRGKILLPTDPTVGLDDLERACTIRERIALEPEALALNADDVASETQALMTFAMGLENLMNAYSTGNEAHRNSARADGYAKRLESALATVLDRDPEGMRTFAGTSRIVVSLILHAESRGESAARWREFLEHLYVPEQQRLRLLSRPG